MGWRRGTKKKASSAVFQINLYIHNCICLVETSGSVKYMDFKIIEALPRLHALVCRWQRADKE